MNLLVDGKAVRTAVGPNPPDGDPPEAGGSRQLAKRNWDVLALRGRLARLQIVDARGGPWGHVSVDHVVLSDSQTMGDFGPPPQDRLLTANGTHLLVPIAVSLGEREEEPRDAWGSSRRVSPDRLSLYADGKYVQSFHVYLPRDDEPAWTAAYPLAPLGLVGHTFTLRASSIFRGGEAAGSAEEIRVGAAAETRDAPPVTAGTPAAAVSRDGQWHLFHLRDPFGGGGNVHWGRRTSRDLLTWTEQPLALFPPNGRRGRRGGLGVGSAAIDAHETAGHGPNRLFLASGGEYRPNRLAHGDGGGAFEAVGGRSPLPHTTGAPYLFWHEPTQRWVLTAFDDDPSAETRAVPCVLGGICGVGPRWEYRQVEFYRSKDLIRWERAGALTFPDRGKVPERPELYELPLLADGKPSGERRWVMSSRGMSFLVGRFDGSVLVPEGEWQRLARRYVPGVSCEGPGGRRVLFGRGVPPREITLHATPDGPRVRLSPVPERAALRGDVLFEGTDLTAAAVSAALRSAAAGGPIETHITFATTGEHAVMIGGIGVGLEETSAVVFIDGASVELFADNGLGYEMDTRRSNAEDENDFQVLGEGSIASLTVYRLKAPPPPAAAE